MKQTLSKNNNLDVDNIKILFQGKILKNEQQLQEYKLEENSKLTLFISQSKPQEQKVLPTTEEKKEPSSTTANVIKPAVNKQPEQEQPVVEEPGLNDMQDGNEQQILNQMLQQNELTEDKKQMINTLKDMG
jgi:hypothetical protein